ncbi:MULTISPECIES: Ger(x)C family spore germination protein [Brevibacillus]|jgi:Ger(x)C family germination protein|uniref:Ger(x)C family spore germination protein n=1 Tax=Brevibacillus TaxID=55080 RepID=UPI000EEB228D|nr:MULTISPECIES: Ger(x)C family spore germination protein [Brevibacillus]MDH6350598.1 Ger(x)C family germination protein [Brevibacillus sp. 1238]WDV94537.1 Ger(x)C family spore germination protein [Brevibacillus parabrevis]HBZ81453.1 Ger(x)C family spore germination protein [Brevibacillus sp.]
MSKAGKLLLISALFFFLSGCMDRIDLEDATITLMAGVDVNEKDELLFYLSSPVFSREAKKKSEEFGVKAESFRQARARLDEMVTGLTLSGKIQAIVLGKRLLEHPDWFKILDVIFRDARFTVNARMVYFDGEVGDLFHFQPPDKPRLSLHLTKLIDTANQRNLTVRTRAQDFHRQMFEKGINPTITAVGKEKAIKILGTAVLSKEGTYVELLQSQETMLLQLFLHGKEGEVTFTVPIPAPNDSKKMIKHRVSLIAKQASKKVKTTFRDGKFHFEVKMKFGGGISERLFPFDMEKDYKDMEQMVNAELRKEFGKLVVKCQQNEVDPFGFGLYARAHAYQEWKKVQDNWPKAFAQAEVKFVPELSIKGNGVIR